MKCIIVESPAKAKKFSSMLPKDEYIVTSSFGHFRDLDSKCMSINTETFDPNYIITNTKISSQLKKFCKEVGKENIILGPDDDREGEAIGFHIAELLKIPLTETKRIKFNEISKKAILKALETPIPLDMNWVDSQQGRRIIDRLVGYSISPLLWKHIPGKTGLSAGRVQSATLKIINEKEAEIKKYERSYTFEVSAKFNDKYDAEYQFSKEEKKPNEDTIEDILVNSVSNINYKVLSKQVKKENKNPPPPFTTSTLQQEATYSGINISNTMNIAQKLYEAGLITYMRTDSVSLSPDFIKETKKVIIDKYSDKYFKSRMFKTKTKGAQEAHEAIRPTDPTRHTLIGAHPLSTKLYEMIYKRTIASQMATSILDVYSIDMTNGDINGVYKLKDKVICFDGWQKVYNREVKKSELDNITKETLFKIDWAKSVETPNSPAARYTESSIIKTLESTGIGRPSTFASILDTLYKREYIEKKATAKETIPRKTLTIWAATPDEMEEDDNPLIRQPQKNKLFITELGIKVLEYLLEHFDPLINKDFTSDIEARLGSVAEGSIKWKDLVKEVFDTFHPTVLEQKEQCESISVSKNTVLGEMKGDKIISTGSNNFGPYLLLENKVKESKKEKGKFYTLSYSLEKNEKTIEEITIKDALSVIKSYDDYQKNRPAKPEGTRTYINVSYADKDKAKKLGAIWDKDKKSWCFCENLDRENKDKLLEFGEISKDNENRPAKPEGKRTYIKVSYDDKDKVKKLGAIWDKDKKSWCFCENLDTKNKKQLLKYK
jgi:DNA topoisomerase-1